VEAVLEGVSGPGIARLEARLLRLEELHQAAVADRASLELGLTALEDKVEQLAGRLGAREQEGPGAGEVLGEVAALRGEMATVREGIAAKANEQKHDGLDEEKGVALFSSLGPGMVRQELEEFKEAKSVDDVVTKEAMEESLASLKRALSVSLDSQSARWQEELEVAMEQLVAEQRQSKVCISVFVRLRCICAFVQVCISVFAYLCVALYFCICAGEGGSARPSACGPHRVWAAAVGGGRRGHLVGEGGEILVYRGRMIHTCLRVQLRCLSFLALVISHLSFHNKYFLKHVMSKYTQTFCQRRVVNRLQWISCNVFPWTVSNGS
jgi:hypothetical protein